jgi:hypothetical protein
MAMRSITLTLGSILLLSLPLGAAKAQNYQDSVGPYGEIAFAFGWPSINSRFTVPPTTGSGTMIGLSFTGGYRINSLIAVDAEFLWVGGGDLSTFGVQFSDASLMAITGNIKFYPLSKAPDLIVEWIQPYVVMGIGSGLGQSTPAAYRRTGIGTDNVNVFMGRFGGGVEILLDNHWGIYLDGNYYVASDEVFDGAGTLGVGVLYSF